MEESGEKIQQKLRELNEGQSGPWIAGEGFHALQKFTFKPDPATSSMFHQKEGYPVKFFLNT